MKFVPKIARLVVPPPSKRQNNNTSQVRLLQGAVMPPSGPPVKCTKHDFKFFDPSGPQLKTGGLKME